MRPFWPRRSPHFAACRHAVRPFDGPAVIGLSGGPDSLALAAAAAAEAKDAVAVVVDHGLQPGSADIAQRAAEQARAWGLEAQVVRVDVAPGNLEAQARRARYAALRAAGREVWVAHTAEDQAETLLLGALRGNPSGMAPREGGVARPFLTLRRADTLGACAELGVEPWHDPMNADASFRRVRVRREVIPQLCELIGGDAVPALATTAARIAQGRELVASISEGAPTDDCAELARDPAPVRRRRLVAWLAGHGVAPGGAQLEDIDALVVRWKGQGPVTLAGGRSVRRVAGRLVVT
ncbi:tRNA lysidine(34) synthetase TilS [Corynebacterium timonense]|uniref:tRNA(Ile)-lysidine synthase n=1 Tax=Corynebacterium timonense TaxID=441500 RepID=A0A1H1L452_9CORY|nr:tRNA lysidine(34) synthetase TilS [Corynebacterium timonense]SDR69316.1 tRNA(Ile)-lysidine synthase [Corynebacterium timonense]